jgi:AcrR family transcriptional regulator
VAAATRLFTERGFAGTSVVAVAAAAEVAAETVYAAFTTKSALLLAAVDVAIVGDADPVPLVERAEFAAAGTGSRVERLARGAQIITDISQRAAGIDQVLREAAGSDPELAGVVAERERGRRDVLGRGMALVLGRPLDPATLDALWAVCSDQLYLMLVRQRGWSPQQYQTWLAGALDRLTREEW